MIHFTARREKDYSRHNILKQVLADLQLQHDLHLLLPFSKKCFFRLWLSRKTVINDFFISDFDTYVNDRRKGSRYSPSALYKRLLDWFNFRFSPYLLSDTRSHFEHWQSLFGNYRGRHFVFPVLADPRCYKPAPGSKPNDLPRILFFGYFIPLHGIDVILRALRICEQQGVKFRADMIGTGQTLEQMLDLAGELELRQVHFNQALIPETELAQRINQSDIVLGIFGDSTKSKSVVPNKVYQALACGSAVITQESPAIREFFSENELCLVERDPAQLAAAITRLLEHPEELERLKQEGYRRYQRLYRESCESLRAFINEIDGAL